MNEHYVYFYIDPRNGKVFYVGCGKGKRMWAHLRLSMRKISCPKNDLIESILDEGLHPMIVVMEWGLSQNEALNSERRWIAFYGKSNLTNRTTGGQGCPGCKPFLGRHHTEKAKELLRQSKLGSRNPMFGKHRTAEALVKFSAKMSGEWHPRWGKHVSDETKEKIRGKLVGFQWSAEEGVKRSEGMRRVWDERKRTGSMPRRNRRMISIHGETKSLGEWLAITGVKKETFHARVRRHGWSVEEALGV